MPLQVIILAAGKGTRMKSDLAKVLHPVQNRPMVDYVIETANELKPANIYLVIGHQAEMVKEATKAYSNIIYVEQKEQLGTGHAVMVVEPALKTHQGTTIILCGDVPLLKAETISGLLNSHKKQKAAATILTIKLNDPKHYGRIIRSTNGDVEKIVEFRDATAEERMCNEINSGIYAVETDDLYNSLKEITTNNNQKEYYLTDIIEILKNKGKKVAAHITGNELEVHGINDQNDLQRAEEEMSHVAVS